MVGAVVVAGVVEMGVGASVGGSTRVGPPVAGGVVLPAGFDVVVGENVSVGVTPVGDGVPAVGVGSDVVEDVWVGFKVGFDVVPAVLLGAAVGLGVVGVAVVGNGEEDAGGGVVEGSLDESALGNGGIDMDRDMKFLKPSMSSDLNETNTLNGE